jgi:Asp-tRNA(Asn)/Glu-tRNA(Gln) amidotransferase C subunit
MLARMEMSLESLKRTAALAGFAWTDAELEAIRPAVQRLLESLAALERLPLGSVEPTTQYRVL